MINVKHHQALPAITPSELLNEVDIVQIDLFGNVVIYLQYMYFVDGLPRFIEASDMPELKEKLAALGFCFSFETFVTFSQLFAEIE